MPSVLEGCGVPAIPEVERLVLVAQVPEHFQDKVVVRRTRLSATTGGRPTLLWHRNNSPSGSFPATLPALSVPAAARGGIAHSGTVADVSALRRGRRVHWGPVKYGYGNGSDWSVTARSCAQRKGSNREPGWCVDARPSPESDLCGNAQSEKYGMS